MIDIYFRRPLLYDYLFCGLITGGLYTLYARQMISIPKSEVSVSMTTDLATIALTLAGFVLTLLTVLITFKTGARIPNAEDNEDVPLFDLFFSTGLYYRTTSLLKGCIKSLLFVAILGFTLKLFLVGVLTQYIFFANVIGLIIIATTLWRSLLILTNIINLQKQN
jgi:hypothetical protein